MIQMQQVHGNKVVRVSQKDDGKIIKNCDGLISNDPNVTLCVRVADCLPISLIDKKTRSFGIIHAGWRGLEKEIIEKAVQLMIKEFLLNPKNLKVIIGPHVCQKHYEVKNDVSLKFARYPNAIMRKEGKEFLDLGKIAIIQLIDEGIKKENIEVNRRCTYEDSNFASFRRDKTQHRTIHSLNLGKGF